jgi:hypothetical protein
LDLLLTCSDVHHVYPKKHLKSEGLSPLRANLRASSIPESMLDGTIPDYDDFLAERRKLMALKIKPWFEAL